MDPQQYCQNKAARSGSSFYYSFMFLPEDQRRAITAFYAFCREVDDVVDECSDPNVARIKLQWWREEIHNLFAGTPRHPVTQALTEAIKQYNLPAEHFIEIIDGMEMDLDYNSYPTFNELALYCHRVASIVGIMAAEIFGYENRQTLKYAHELGLAFQLTNILRDLGEDATRGRLYIPLDELERFKVPVDDIMHRRATPELHQLLEFQAARAQRHYQQAYEYLPEIDRYRQRTGLIMAAIYQTLLDEIKSDGYRVLTHRVALTPVRKLWIAWRTARQEKHRHKKQRATKSA